MSYGRELSEEDWATLLNFIQEHFESKGIANWRALAPKAGISQAAISLLRTKQRAAEPTLTAIGEVLAPKPEDSKVFTAQLLKLAKLAGRPGIQQGGSIADRILAGGPIRAACVVNAPFVNPPDSSGRPTGFAIELFGYLCRLLGVSDEPRLDVIDLKELRTAFAHKKYDLVVSAILPTVRRRQYMAFTRPLPFLRLPLSALVRRGSCITVFHLLNWREELNRQTVAGESTLSGKRVLLINSEVGDEFATTFLSIADFDRVDSLEPNDIYPTLARGFDVLLADVATCLAVLEEDDRQEEPIFEFIAEDARDATKGLARKLTALTPVSPDDRPPVLALYHCAFAMPKGDKAWKDLIDEAMDAMLFEGIRPLIYLFQKHSLNHAFIQCLEASDDSVTSSPALRAFRFFVQMVKNQKTSASAPKAAAGTELAPFAKGHKKKGI